ncbi:hypothetical protein Taro_023980 [Colocasia esculenta]|uniref:Uncharacterized protein n=1 Tax=Colocasia esculenta TaxID=4460 RepID=A0A843UYZ6_COLES|nr:hypothetical protein [Colocasia esculenta]
MVSQNSVPAWKFCPGACVIVHRKPYPSIGRKYLFARGSEPPARPQFGISTSTRSISIRPGVGTSREATTRNRHFDPVGKRSHSEISGPAQNSSPGAWSRAIDPIAYGHLFTQTCITFYSVIRIVYKTTIRNRHSETPDAPLSPKICVRPRVGTTREAPIRNRHCDPVSKRSHSEISGPAQNSSPGAWSRAADAIAYRHLFAQMGITFYSRLPRLRESLEELTHGACLSRRSVVVFNSSRDLVPRSLISKELCITFHLSIEIANVITIRNRHSETVDRTLVSRNSVPAPEFLPGACVIVHRQPYPSTRRRYLFARGSKPLARPQFGIGTSTRSVKGRIRRFLVLRKIPLWERGRGPSMRSHTDTSSLKRA